MTYFKYGYQNKYYSFPPNQTQQLDADIYRNINSILSDAPEQGPSYVYGITHNIGDLYNTSIIGLRIVASGTSYQGYYAYNVYQYRNLTTIDSSMISFTFPYHLDMTTLEEIVAGISKNLSDWQDITSYDITIGLGTFMNYNSHLKISNSIKSKLEIDFLIDNSSVSIIDETTLCILKCVSSGENIRIIKTATGSNAYAELWSVDNTGELSSKLYDLLIDTATRQFNVINDQTYAIILSKRVSPYIHSVTDITSHIPIQGYITDITSYHNISDITNIFSTYNDSIILDYSNNIGVINSGTLAVLNSFQKMVAKCTLTSTENSLYLKKNLIFQNKTPNLSMSIRIYDSNNTLTFDSSSGNYNGIVSFGTGLNTIKIIANDMSLDNTYDISCDFTLNYSFIGKYSISDISNKLIKVDDITQTSDETNTYNPDTDLILFDGIKIT